jgi:hypothetical protein
MSSQRKIFKITFAFVSHTHEGFSFVTVSYYNARDSDSAGKVCESGDEF